MREVHLHGALGLEFGWVHRFVVSDIPDALQALNANFPKFTSMLRHGFYKVIVGDMKTGVEMDDSTIVSYRIGTHDIHIIPVTKGRGRGGLGKLLAGILLVGLAIATGGMSMMATGILGSATTLGGIMTSVGTGMILTGVASILAPATDGSDDSQKSFTMSGPQVTLKEGGIIPIVYGECVTGGTMISGILRIENAVDENTTEPSTVITAPSVATEPRERPT